MTDVMRELSERVGTPAHLIDNAWLDGRAETITFSMPRELRERVIASD